MATPKTYIPVDDLKYFESLENAQVDEAAGIIKDVSVITRGVAKGYNLLIDATTLQQVKTCADAYAGGVKVKMDHGSGVGGVAGMMKNFRIKGAKLIADLHLLKSHPAFNQIIEMARTMPDTFGMSVAFSGKDEQVGDLMYARCGELYSIDLVDQPAANPSGLFSVPVDTAPSDEDSKNSHTMSKENPTPDFASMTKSLEALSTQIAALSAKVDAQDAKLHSLSTPPAPPAAPAAPVAPSDRKLSELTEADLKKLMSAEVARSFSELGVRAPSAPAANPNSDGGNAPAAKKTFAALVNDQIALGKKKTEAVSLVIRSNPAEYAEFQKTGGKL